VHPEIFLRGTSGEVHYDISGAAAWLYWRCFLKGEDVAEDSSRDSGLDPLGKIAILRLLDSCRSLCETKR